MNLLRAEIKAKYLVGELELYCEKIEIVGNIRCRKDTIDKIDILLAPISSKLFDLMARITELGSDGGIKVSSKQTVFLKDDLYEIKADLWFTDLSKWPVMLLLKTGGTKSNQKIAKLCEGKKWQFSVQEAAIFDENGKKLLIEKEEDIFTLLEIPFIEPSWRK